MICASVRRGRSDTDGLQVGTGVPREASGNPGATYRFYFNIGSVDSFERKMEEAQEDLGLAPSAWVRPTNLTQLQTLASNILVPGCLVAPACFGLKVNGECPYALAPSSIRWATSLHQLSAALQNCYDSALGAPYSRVCAQDAQMRGTDICSSGRQVPITYTREMAWATELLRLLPTIGLIGLYIWFTRRQLGGGFGGGGGMGGRGIFNVGKAQVRRLHLRVVLSL